MKQHLPLWPGVLMATLLMVLALFSAIAVTGPFGEGWDIRLLRAAITSGIVFGGLVLLRRWSGQPPWRPGPTLPAVRQSGAGVGLALAGIALCTAAAVMAGLATIEAGAPSADWIVTMLLLTLTALFFEALPEEALFRGHIYSRLRHRYGTTGAMLWTTALFIAMAALLSLTGGVGTVEQYGLIAYLVQIAIFGLVLAACRAAAGTVWTGIGFHMGWLIVGGMILAPREGAPLTVNLQHPDAIVLLVFGPYLLALATLWAWGRLNRHR